MAKFPVQFPASVVEKLRTGAGHVQKTVQEITPYGGDFQEMCSILGLYVL